MNPGQDHVLNRLASPLWCHVADALDGHKVESIVLFDVSRYLAVSEPGSPFFFNGPAEQFKPLFSSIGGDSAISVT